MSKGYNFILSTIMLLITTIRTIRLWTPVNFGLIVWDAGTQER